MAERSFQPDPLVAEAAAKHAQEAVVLAASNFGVTLDGSEGSVEQVERLLGRLHDEKGRARPPETTLRMFAKAFGSYVGEVLRRHHGATWGMVRTAEGTFPGMQQAGGEPWSPWAKAYRRLVDGPAEDVWDHYRVLAGGAASPPPKPKPPPATRPPPSRR